MSQVNTRLSENSLFSPNSINEQKELEQYHLFGRSGTYNGCEVSAEMLQEFILSKNGNPAYLDTFQRFFLGSACGKENFIQKISHENDLGSTDLWLRNSNDGVEIHQDWKAGQSNWLNAKVWNEAGSGKAKHIIVTFQVKPLFTEYSYPEDFLSMPIFRAEAYLYPGNSAIVKTCLPEFAVSFIHGPVVILASIISREKGISYAEQHWTHNKVLVCKLNNPQ